MGLTSLGYLWRREQTELLQEMIDSEVEAILVKVASIGLQPRRHLGKTIAQLQPQLMMLVSDAAGRFDMEVYRLLTWVDVVNVLCCAVSCTAIVEREVSDERLR